MTSTNKRKRKSKSEIVELTEPNFDSNEFNRILKQIRRAYLEEVTFRSNYLKLKSGKGQMVAQFLTDTEGNPVIAMKYKYLRPETLFELAKWVKRMQKDRQAE